VESSRQSLCHLSTWQSAKAFLIFFITEFFADCLDELVVKSVLIFSEQKFFADCLYWQVAKDSLPTAFIGWW